MSKKYYAVRVGRTTGIFNDWETCKAQVHQYAGAVYKSFKTLKDAELYMDGIEVLPIKSTVPKTPVNGEPLVGHSTINRSDARDQNIIYTDGACRNNGLPDAIAGVGAHGMCIEISEPLPGPKQTNQRAEIWAAVRALETLLAMHENSMEIPAIEIRTDSKYVIKSMTLWVNNWIDNDWYGIENRDMLRYLHGLTQLIQVTWTWVKGHSGNAGNNVADRLAVRGYA